MSTSEGIETAVTELAVVQNTENGSLSAQVLECMFVGPRVVISIASVVLHILTMRPTCDAAGSSIETDAVNAFYPKPSISMLILDVFRLLTLLSLERRLLGGSQP